MACSNILNRLRHSLRCSPVQSQSNKALKTAIENWKSKNGFKTWPQFECARDALHEKIILLGKLFTRQCNVIAAMRIRRGGQIYGLYSQIYSEKTIEYVVKRFSQTFLRRGKGRPICMLLGAALFQWDNKSITQNELESCTEDMNHVMHLKDRPADANYMDTWEPIIDKYHLKAWRKAIPNSYMYEYKVYGTYNDVPARAFFDANLDLEYRKHWDKFLIKLECIDADQNSGQQVIRWVVHYPYPMYGREFIYVRRQKVDVENNVMVIVARATDHPSYPESNKYVRVSTYNSKMVIKPHKSFDENGFDYVLTYSDDPQTTLPSVAYNYAASTGVPDFVDKLHNAAMQLHAKPWLKRGTKEAPSANEDDTQATQVPMYQ